MWLTKRLTPSKQMHEVSKNQQITLVLVLLTPKMTLLTATLPIRSLTPHYQMLFLSTIDKSCCKIFKKQGSLLLKTSAGLKTHRKTCMVKFNFSKTTSFKRKASAMKEMFDILTISFLLINVTVFTSCKVKSVILPSTTWILGLIKET